MQGKRKLHEETEAIWHQCFLRLLLCNQEHIQGRILSEIGGRISILSATRSAIS